MGRKKICRRLGSWSKHTTSSVTMEAAWWMGLYGFQLHWVTSIYRWCDRRQKQSDEFCCIWRIGICCLLRFQTSDSQCLQRISGKIFNMAISLMIRFICANTYELLKIWLKSLLPQFVCGYSEIEVEDLHLKHILITYRSSCMLHLRVGSQCCRQV